jgi:dipeptidyl aminopeptidase/acylaminoacyl peptidase
MKTFRLVLAALVLACLPASALHAQAPASETIAVPGNLITRGIPPIPRSVVDEVARYGESRSAGFSGWHPTQRRMLISTRFGNTAQLHELKARGGARTQLTFFQDAVGGGSYEPFAARYLIFSKDSGGNEFDQLYRMDFSDGKVTQLTPGGRTQNGGLRWAHDKKRIAYTSTARNGSDRDVWLMDPLSPAGKKLLVENAGGGWGIADWSPDDKTLLLREGISANESHYWLLDVATRKKTALTPRTEAGIALGGARFDKVGRGIYFTTDKEAEFSRLAYMPLSGGGTTYFTTALPWGVEGFDMSEDGKMIAFTTNEAGLSKLYLFNTTAKKYAEVKGLPVGVIGGASFHPVTNELAVAVSNASSPSDVYTVKPATGAVARWTESELGGLQASQLQTPSLVKWKSFDGQEISGFYYKAPGRFTGKRPVVISIHGGPEGQSQPGFQGGNNFFLNELGVAMILPNVRGSSGYGKTFLAADNGYKREESVRDIGALLDWIATQPDLDASRVMVMGGSYGGYMTLAVSTTYPDRIRCAIDIVGISNFNTFLKNTESYRRDLRRVEYGDERDRQMAAFLEKISPLTNASKITKPLFIIQGGNDPRVPRTEAVQMADKVAASGGTVWYLEAKDEGHGFRKKGNQDFMRWAVVEFMRRYLL